MQKYDPDLIPPDFRAAKLHSHAHRVGLYDKIEVCPCCGQIVNNKILPLLVDKDQLTFLGSGYPLYFTFIKTCMILLCLNLMAIGQYSLVRNFQGLDCYGKLLSYLYVESGITNICMKDFVSELSLANRRSDVKLNYISDLLSFTSSILLMSYIIYFRVGQKQLDLQCDIEEVTPSDYTVMVYGLNNEENIDKRLKQYFQKDVPHGTDQKISVKKINLAYDLSEITKLRKERQKVIKEKKVAYKDGLSFDNQKLKQIDKSIRAAKKTCKFAGVAFVSFKYDYQKEFILEKGQVSISSLICNSLTGLQFDEGFIFDFYGEEIKIQQAPEPTDINWKSIYPWAKESISRRLLGAFMALLSFLILTVAAYFLALKQASIAMTTEKNFFQSEDMLSKHSIRVHIYSFAYSILICLINSLFLDIVVRKIVSFQAFPTYSQKNTSIAQKLSIMMFLNSAFLQFLIFVRNDRIYEPGGLIYNITYFFISNAVVPPFVKFIDPDYIIQRIKKFYYKRTKNLVQSEANELFEHPEHAIEQGYADIIKTLNVAFFFGPLLPVGYLLSLLGLILYYWAEKYTLLRRKTVNHSPSFELSSRMTDQLELIPLIQIISYSLFNYLVMNQTSWINLVALIIALIFYYCPNDKIIELFWQFEDNVEYQKYDEMNFAAHYDRSNPVTQSKALKHWMHRFTKQEKKELDQLEKEEDFGTLKQKHHELKEQLELFEV